MSDAPRLEVPPTHVLFDCDGVLVDSEAIAVTIESEALTEAGFPLSVAEVSDRFVGLSHASVAKEIEREFGRPLPDGFSDRLEAETLARFDDELRAVPGIGDVLAASRLPRCVASSSDVDRILRSLRLTGLAGHFAEDRIFSAQMVERGKPEPDLFLLAADRMGADPAQCVVVEDSPHGTLAGVRAGMTVIGLTAGGHAGPSLTDRLRSAGASHVVATTTELATLLTTGV